MLLITLVLPHYAYAFTNGQAAVTVIGQTGFTSSAGAGGFCGGTASASKLCNPYIIAFDASGNLWVADVENSRVLRFPSPLSTGEGADVVIGQTSFTTSTCYNPGVSASTLCDPVGIAFDSSGNLWVADSSNNRVLRYPSPFSTGESADLVIGQTTFTSSAGTGIFCAGGPASASTLCSPRSIAFDPSGNLWVNDYFNSRVLRFPSPFSTGESADLVIGQTDFTSNTGAGGGCGGITSASRLCPPEGIVLDVSGNLWVADDWNQRVLRYPSPFSTGESADLVIGQTGFMSSGCGTTASTLCYPEGIALDVSGNLWVVDGINNRVLRYPSPFSTGEGADLVIGQTSFTTGTCNSGGVSASTLCDPFGVAFDSSGNLWATDQYDNRVLRYSTAIASTTMVTPNPSSVIIGNTITYTVTVSGSGPTPTGTVTWSSASGSFSGGGSCMLSSGSCTITYTPPPSPGPVTITATYGGDSNYAASSGKSSLTVLTPAQAIQNLINLKDSMNLPQGVTNSLDAKLNAALNSINGGQSTAAKNQLDAFINEVNAQTGKKITGAEAAQLIAAADDIIIALP